MRKAALLVSAHTPGPLFPWIQLPVTVAPVTSQNLVAPAQPHPGVRASQSSVLFPVISLLSMTTLVIPSGR